MQSNSSSKQEVFEEVCTVRTYILTATICISITILPLVMNIIMYMSLQWTMITAGNFALFNLTSLQTPLSSSSSSSYFPSLFISFYQTSEREQKTHEHEQWNWLGTTGISLHWRCSSVTPPSSALHCSALLCTALHCTALLSFFLFDFSDVAGSVYILKSISHLLTSLFFILHLFIYYLLYQAAMSMPIPPPAITLPHAWATRSVGGGGRVDGQSSDIEGVFVPSVSHSTFSVTMPCALAWREKTGAVQCMAY